MERIDDRKVRLRRSSVGWSELPVSKLPLDLDGLLVPVDVRALDCYQLTDPEAQGTVEQRHELGGSGTSLRIAWNWPMVISLIFFWRLVTPLILIS